MPAFYSLANLLAISRLQKNNHVGGVHDTSTVPTG